MPEICGGSVISTDYVGEVVIVTIEQSLSYNFYDHGMGAEKKVVL